LTKTVINNVSPSFQDLNDSININDYIKIKLIKYLKLKLGIILKIEKKIKMILKNFVDLII
jgi:hypothetical protein